MTFKQIEEEKMKKIVEIKNKLLIEVKTKYVMWIKQEDLMEPTFLEKSIWFLETHPSISLCGSHFITFGDKGNVFFYLFRYLNIKY